MIETKFIKFTVFLLSSNAYEDDEQIALGGNIMLRPDEFNGDLLKAPYEISNIIHLRDNIVDEILFYGSGYGWASSPTQIRKNTKLGANRSIEVAILFPYIKQTPGESQSEYLRKLMMDVRKELRQRVVGFGTNYRAIDNFEYAVTRVSNDIHQFALLLKK